MKCPIGLIPRQLATGRGNMSILKNLAKIKKFPPNEVRCINLWPEFNKALKAYL